MNIPFTLPADDSVRISSSTCIDVNPTKSGCLRWGHWNQYAIYLIVLGEKDSEFRKFSKGYFMNEAHKKKIWGVVRMNSSASRGSRGSMEPVNFGGTHGMN